MLLIEFWVIGSQMYENKLNWVIKIQRVAVKFETIAKKECLFNWSVKKYATGTKIFVRKKKVKQCNDLRANKLTSTDQ